MGGERALLVMIPLPSPIRAILATLHAIEDAYPGRIEVDYLEDNDADHPGAYLAAYLRLDPDD